MARPLFRKTLMRGLFFVIAGMDLNPYSTNAQDYSARAPYHATCWIKLNYAFAIIRARRAFLRLAAFLWIMPFATALSIAEVVATY